MNTEMGLVHGAFRMNQKGKRRMMFAKYSDCKGKDLTEKVPDLAYRYSHNTTSFEERLKAKSL